MDLQVTMQILNVMCLLLIKELCTKLFLDLMASLPHFFQTCACYYPVQAGSHTYGPFTIETVALDTNYPDLTIRDVTLAYNKKV